MAWHDSFRPLYRPAPGNIVALTSRNLDIDRKETRFTSRLCLWLILTAFTALLAGQGPSQAAPTVLQPPDTNAQFAGPSPVAEAVTKHRFACTDYTQGKVFIVSSEGAVEWEYPAEHC